MSVQVSPAGPRARGVTKAMDQAPFQAADLFQALANYPYFTSDFKFHLIQPQTFKKQASRRLGTRGERSEGCARTNPGFWLPRWRPGS